MALIKNAGNLPLSQQPMGTVPDVSGAMQDYYQPMVFTLVSKAVVGFVLQETPTQMNFRGVIQPFSERRLALLPEGQRAWTWHQLNCDTALLLDVDDVVLWRGRQTRVMSRKDFGLYGYYQFTLCQDWGGSGP